jgi:hypothetical protein
MSEKKRVMAGRCGFGLCDAVGFENWPCHTFVLLKSEFSHSIMGGVNLIVNERGTVVNEIAILWVMPQKL